jgi:thioredoxin-related protein
MRHRFTYIAGTVLLLLSFMGTLRAEDKSKLQWLSFEKGLAEAKKTNKKMLVDVYTNWCGWCKRMDADTYSNSDVSSYLKEKYVVVKMNAESASKQYTEQELAGQFGVTGYPTTLFFTSDGRAITAVPGYAPAADFKTILSYIAEDRYLDTKFEDYARSKK